MWPFILIVYIDSLTKTHKTPNKHLFSLLGLLVAIAFYVRFFYGLFGFITIGSYLFSRFISERKYSFGLYFSISMVISYILFGLLIFHDQTNVINYIKINYQLSFSNSVDMTYDVKNTNFSFIIPFIVLAVLNLFLILKKRLNLIITVNIIWLLLFKLGFSRTDHYFDYFVIPAAILSLVMLLEKGWLGRILFLISMMSLIFLITYPIFPGAKTFNPLNNKINLEENYHERMKDVYPSFRLDDDVVKKISSSTIDIYPYNNEYAFSNNLNYLHRPLFQNYMTLTPTLDKMNASFFESPKRPKFLLWTAGVFCSSPDCNIFDGFDMKYTLNEDPLTSISIMSNYHPVLLSSGKNGTPVMLLEENSSKENIKETILSEQKMKFGQWYSVPKFDSGLIKIKPDFKFTLLGRLKNMLFRGNILKIRYKLLDGQEKTYRVNILNSKSGVILSPLLNKFDTLGFSGNEVKSFMFEIDTNNYFEDKFTAKIVNINIPNITVTHPKTDKELFVSSSALNDIDCEASIDTINSTEPGKKVTELSHILTVNGWMVFSTDTGILFDKKMLTLTDESGHTRFFIAQKTPRQDVADFFKNRVLSDAGFSSLVNIAEMKGNYHLSLAGSHDNKFYSCKNIDIPIVIN